MRHPATRRDFLSVSAAALTVGSGLLDPKPAQAVAVANDSSAPINVVVWDERQPTQKEAYDHFLGNRIAEHLRSVPGIAVKSVGQDDPEFGLTHGVFDDAQVLIWWGHVRQKDLPAEVGQRILSRIKAGTLGLIALHSAHWSTPFIAAMDERSRVDAIKKWSRPGEKGGDCGNPADQSVRRSETRRPGHPLVHCSEIS